MSCEKKLRYANTQSYSSVIPRMRVQIFVFVIFIKALFRNWDSRLQHLCRRIEANIFYCQVLCLHNSSFLLPFGYNIMPYNLELYISLLHLFPPKYVLFITYQQELYFESWLSVGRMESYCGPWIKRTSTAGTASACLVWESSEGRQSPSPCEWASDGHWSPVLPSIKSFWFYLLSLWDDGIFSCWNFIKESCKRFKCNYCESGYLSPLSSVIIAFDLHGSLNSEKNSDSM